MLRLNLVGNLTTSPGYMLGGLRHRSISELFSARFPTLAIAL